MDLQTIHSKLTHARYPEDVFGDNGIIAKVAYSNLIRECHPDLHKNDPVAAEATTLVNVWWEKAKAKIAEGYYGDLKRITPITIRSKKGSYTLTELIAEEDISNVYRASTLEIVKVVKSSRDNDLMQAEIDTLKSLEEDKLQPFIPQVVESLQLQIGKERRKVNVFKGDPYKLPWYTLKEVKEVYPQGIDPLDMIWMFRRILYALGMVHETTVVHGGVVPSNILIQPKEHGLQLGNWCYSIKRGQTVKAIIPEYKDLYPSEITDKKPADFSTDIYLTAESMLHITDVSKMTQRMKAFFRGCVLIHPYHRSHAAWDLLGELDDLLGKRHFRPFSMPSSS